MDYVFQLLEVPWFYCAIAALAGAAAWRIWKRPSLGLLVAYYILLLAETVFIRKPFNGQHFQPELFWSWKVWKVQRDQILANIVMFIPVGAFAGSSWKWRGLWIAAGMSAVIEVMQLITARGLCEFDDVVHNCLGAVIGIGIVLLSYRVIEKYRGFR